MDQAFCHACGIQVEVVEMTMGTGVSAQEFSRCINCGFDLTNAAKESGSDELFGKVAIVEDMQQIRKAVKEDILKHKIAGFVDEFEDGGKFIQSLRKAPPGNQPYNLVILDLNMPVVDGMKTAQFIRTMEKPMGWQPIPILFFSSVVCDQRLQQRVQTMSPALYLNKATIKSRQNLPDRLRHVLDVLKLSTPAT